jgi:hypothetical protein
MDSKIPFRNIHKSLIAQYALMLHCLLILRSKAGWRFHWRKSYIGTPTFPNHCLLGSQLQVQRAQTKSWITSDSGHIIIANYCMLSKMNKCCSLFVWVSYVTFMSQTTSQLIVQVNDKMLRNVLESLSCISTVVIICTTCFNTPKLCIMPTQCISVFRMVLTINSDCFPKQH